MMPTKLLLTGATGFIGTRLCELLKLRWRLPYRALVRNYTRAARIARLDAEMVPGELGDLDSIIRALEGCDTLVHLAHGEDDRAPQDTANVVTAALRTKVKRFVHLSSMAVHGSNPGPECAREATARLVTRGDVYPVSKAKQERLVQRAIDRDGLPGIILRPTVVIGPYGGFAAAPVQMAKTGVLDLIDEGRWPCNFVMVDDVCSAIHAAITSDAGLGKAFFVTADHAVTWRDFNLTFGRMANPDVETVSFDSAELRAYWAKQQPTLASNLTAAARLVCSPELHRQLGNVPVVKSAITWAKQAVKARLDDEQVLLLKSRLSTRPRAAAGPNVARPAMSRVLREVFPLEFSNELIKETLGWRPAYDFARAAEVTRRWLEFARLIPRDQPSIVSMRTAIG